MGKERKHCMNIEIEPCVKRAIESAESSGCRAYLCEKSVRDILLGNKSECYTFLLTAPEGCEGNKKAYNSLRKLGHVHGVYFDLDHFQSERLFTSEMPIITKDGEVLDFFNGVADIQRRTIRCVPGWESELPRFPDEILRIISMESEEGFSADTATRKAMISHAGLIRLKTAPGIAMRYLSRILLGSFAENSIVRNEQTLSVVFHELSQCSALFQNTPYTAGTLYSRMARAIGVARKDLYVRTALFFLYTGFPSCRENDETGFDIFSRKAYLASEGIARRYMTQLGYKQEDTGRVCALIANQAPSPQDIDIRGFLMDNSAEQAQRLLDIQEADTIAQCRPDEDARLEKIAEMRLMVHDSMRRA